jgi:phosphofructokinase-like protein
MRIAITTGGGDCPGLNAVIRAVTLTAIGRYGWEVVGIGDGLGGLVRPDKLFRLNRTSVRGILSRGGTILGSTNQGNPFRWRVEDEAGVREEDRSDLFVERLQALGIDAVVFVGGDGTQTIANSFAEKGVAVVGVPKTIDNDLEATDQTFGFDTAVQVATDALDRLRTTAESHDRVMILEVMGRTAGWIALHAGLSGDADVILLPELPYDIDAVVEHLKRKQQAGIEHAVVVVAEGASPRGEGAVTVEAASAGRNARLGGAGERFAAELRERHPFDTRVTVLGHVQRGGTPSAVDRALGTRFGVHAVEVLANGDRARLVVLRGTEVTSVPLAEAAGRVKNVPLDSDLLTTAESVGISLGR